jgi:hypothetical protein
LKPSISYLDQTCETLPILKYYWLGSVISVSYPWKERLAMRRHPIQFPIRLLMLLMSLAAVSIAYYRFGPAVSREMIIAQDPLTAVNYSFADIGANDERSLSSIKRLAMLTVEPDNWDLVDVSAEVEVAHQSIRITHNQAMHTKLRGLFADLRTLHRNVKHFGITDIQLR